MLLINAIKEVIGGEACVLFFIRRMLSALSGALFSTVKRKGENPFLSNLNRLSGLRWMTSFMCVKEKSLLEEAAYL
jgi:hypothetical protein